MGMNGRWRWPCWKELQIDRVRVVCSCQLKDCRTLSTSAPTDWDHAFGIVVEVFQHHFAQRVDLAATAHSKSSTAYTVVHTTSSYPKSHILIVPNTLLFFTQKATLFFQPSQQPPKLPDNLAITRPISLIFANHDSKIKYEFVPFIFFLLLYADGIANDAVMVDAARKQAVAELLSGNEVLRDRRKRKKRCWEGRWRS